MAVQEVDTFNDSVMASSIVCHLFVRPKDAFIVSREHVPIETLRIGTTEKAQLAAQLGTI